MKIDVKILSVNLDGTLIKSDLLWETFWSSFSKDSLIPLKALIVLIKGRAYLKNFLYINSTLDISSLPYNNEVIEYIILHRAKGWRIALITSNNQKLADDISQHLNLFDEVYGSKINKNLEVSAKANFQEQIFGSKKFNYVGNSYSDLETWKISNKAITFNAGKSLRRKCEKINLNHFHLINNKPSNFFNSFFKEIRPNQWVKNILVFVPMIAAQDFDVQSIVNSFLALVAFCFTASSIYVFNDLLDINADRNHPKKCKRPFASGELPFSSGSFGGLILLILGLTIGLIVGTSFLNVLLIYFFITLSYSLFFKRRELIDIFILSALYTIRIIAGSFATNLDISFWLLAFSIFIFLSLASVKREAELIDIIKRGKVRIENRGYKNSDLEFVKILSISSGMISILLLSLYINSSKVIGSYSNPEFLWGACILFLFWIIRVCFKTHRGEMEHDPIIFAVKDKLSNFIFLTIIILVWISMK